MIKVSFIEKRKNIVGFSLVGHGTKNSHDDEGRLVCAAVSSAVYMTANTLTDIIGAKAEISDNGDVFSLKVTDKISESQPLLRGLRLHLTELQKDYKKSITINSEV